MILRRAVRRILIPAKAPSKDQAVKPRYYQSEAIAACWRYIKSNAGSPCIVLPTGAGKSLTMALMIRDCLGWDKRVMLVTHAKELLEQIEATLNVIGITDVGIYSAGLESRSTGNAVILGGIQSVYNRASEFGPRDVCFIDEAHRINPRSDGTMYGQFFTDLTANHPCRLIGLTATPYRLGSGYICDEDSWLNQIVYEASVKKLVDEGFLCRLTSKWMPASIDSSELKVNKGEFTESSQQAAFLEANAAICEDIIERTQDRNSTLMFCSGVEAVKEVRQYFVSRGIACGAITGDTPDDIRDEYIEAFRDGTIQYLANCNVLTEGFDAPNIDCVAVMRATLSPGLFYQMAGRGLRLHPSKKNCLILDYGENLDRHGAIDQISPRIKGGNGRGNTAGGLKPCPSCALAVPIATKVCPECDHEFEFELKQTLGSSASKSAALSDEAELKWLAVGSIRVNVHTKKGGDDSSPRTMAVAYYASENAIGSPIARQWVCVEHSGFARVKAEKWWKKWSKEKLPTIAEDACELLESGLASGELQIPKAIGVQPQKDNPKYLEVVDLTWDASKVTVELKKSTHPMSFFGGFSETKPKASEWKAGQLDEF